MTKKKKTWLTHTGIETLERCPRCFWLRYKRGIYQPEGIVSRLANRFDVVLKNYFQSFRVVGELPPMVVGKLEGKLENPLGEKYFVPIDATYGFWGKLDECLVNRKGEHVPVDFKTSSTDPRKKEVLAAYQSQIDDYIFLLKQNKKSVSGYGYLVYVYPDESRELHHGFPMIVHVEKLAGDPKRTATRIAKAIGVLEDDMPSPSSTCPFCSWYEKIKEEVEL